MGGRLAFLGLHDELDQLSVLRKDEIHDRPERPTSPPRGEAADRGEGPCTLAVEVELLTHQNEGRRDGDRVREDLARCKREVPVGAVAAEDVETEDPPQLVVEKDVHDDTEANVGIANGSRFDRACAKTPVHRPGEFPHRRGRN